MTRPTKPQPKRARPPKASRAERKPSRADARPPRAEPREAEGPRLRLDVDERRARLLDLGLAVFGERSYEQISIDDIAARADMSKGLLYHYFGSKRGFYVATIRHAALALLTHIAPASSLPPAERVATGLDAYLTFVEARRNAFVALMRSGVGADPEVLEIVDGTRTAIVARILEEGLGLSKPPPIFRIALRSWIGAVEAASLEWLEREDLPRSVLVEALSEMLMQTIAIASRLASAPVPRPRRRR